MSAHSPAQLPVPRRIAAIGLAVPLLVALALWAFAWPAARLAPRELPIGVAGPAAATAAVSAQLSSHEGAFSLHQYPDGQAARAAIEDREIYGALVVTPQGPELLTASAASPVVAQLLQGAAQQAAGGAAPAAVRTTDVVPAPAADPRGAVLGAGLLPLVLAGLAAGVLVTVLRLRRGPALAALTVAALGAGAVAALITHSWLGALTGNWFLEAGVLALTVLAVGATAAGAAALIGAPGLGLTALLMVLIGNPFSGVASAPELLPGAAAALGAQLPPGAAGQLLRSVAYFDGAGGTAPAVVLALWAVLGIAAVLLARPARRPAAAPAPEPVGV
ncbi:ABC transporter permease [Kitasatospora sp. NPDC054939]